MIAGGLLIVAGMGGLIVPVFPNWFITAQHFFFSLQQGYEFYEGVVLSFVGATSALIGGTEKRTGKRTLRVRISRVVMA